METKCSNIHIEIIKYPYGNESNVVLDFMIGKYFQNRGIIKVDVLFINARIVEQMEIVIWM